MLAAAAASSILSLSGSNAFAADGEAVAADSPGILSGNSVQAPLDVPVNACGNSADVVGAANPAFGNSCANSGSSPKEHAGAPQQRAVTREDDGSGYGGSDHSPAPDTHSGTQSLAESDAGHSPGILAGNSLQAPLEVPLNLCGNTADVVGALNPVTGNSCANGAPQQPQTPPQHETPPQAAEPPVDRAVLQQPEVQRPRHAAPAVQEMSAVSKPHVPAQLAATGSEQDLLAAAAASAALLIGGGILYRRGFASSRR